MVDKTFDEKLEDVLKDKVTNLINKMNHYNIFRKPDVWDREPNSPYKFLQDCFNDLKPKIKETFNKHVEGAVDKESITMLKEELYSLFDNWASRKFLKED